MSTRTRILELLADQRFHSGTELGQCLGISRAAINKAIAGLVALGFSVHRVRGRGYRLAESVQLLDAKALQQAIAPWAQGKLRVTVLDQVDSTSTYLQTAALDSSVHGRVCLAERQQAGRGRRGRTWVASPYRNILMSMAWVFELAPAAVSGLSLAASVAVVGALNDIGVLGLGIKWPNDIVVQGRKLAGILVDVKGEASGPTTVILGVGINVCLHPTDAVDLDQPWTDLVMLIGEPVDRMRLSVVLIKALAGMFEKFAQQGMAAFEQDWQALHVYSGKRVQIVDAGQTTDGIVLGTDSSGALLLRCTGGDTRRFHSGDVSLRGAQ